MSALGQKRTLKRPHPMSALLPKADIVQYGGNVRFAKSGNTGLSIWRERSRIFHWLDWQDELKSRPALAIRKRR